jgi:hypothetical protein
LTTSARICSKKNREKTVTFCEFSQKPPVWKAAVRA